MRLLTPEPAGDSEETFPRERPEPAVVSDAAFPRERAAPDPPADPSPEPLPLAPRQARIASQAAQAMRSTASSRGKKAGPGAPSVSDGG